MANPFYIPPAESGVSRALDFGAKVQQLKLMGEDVALRGRAQNLAEKEHTQLYGTPGGPPGLKERAMGVNEKTAETQRKQLEFLEKKFKADQGLAMSPMQEGDFFKISGTFAMVDKEHKVGIEKAAKPMVDYIRNMTEQGATRYDIYQAMKGGAWEQFKPRIIENLQKAHTRALTDGDAAQAKTIEDMANFFTSDKFLDQTFPASAVVERKQKADQQIEMMKATKEPKLYETHTGWQPADKAIGQLKPKTEGGTTEIGKMLDELGKLTSTGGKDEGTQTRVNALRQKLFGAAEKDLRDGFAKQSKTFVSVRDSYNRISASYKDPSAAGDLSLIFNYMKMLDPESVVRESEFATAQNSASVPDKIRAAYNKVLSGERMAEGQRADFVNRSKLLMEEQIKTQKQLIGEFTRIAKAKGLDSDNIIIDYMMQVAPQQLDESNPPPADLLKSGKPVEFENGQIWVLRNGTPKRMK